MLIEDVDLLCKCDQVKLLPGVSEALTSLSKAGYSLFVVTNQTVVARGLATDSDVEKVNHCISRQITKNSGPAIQQFYYCSHHPQATVPEYRKNCKCRKPYPGMILKAAAEHNIDLSSSFMVGDRISDIIAGKNAGCATILVKTGCHDQKPIISEAMDLSVEPDFTCNNLSQAAQIILGER